MESGVVVLAESPHWKVELDRARRYVRLRRSAEPLRDVAVIAAQQHQAFEALAGIDRGHYGLLMDVRLGPLRSDAAFESATVQQTPRVLDGFARVAMLVATQVGKLQVTRIARATYPAMRVFDDEAAAVAYATGASDAPPVGRPARPRVPT